MAKLKAKEYESLLALVSDKPTVSIGRSIRAEINGLFTINIVHEDTLLAKVSPWMLELHGSDRSDSVKNTLNELLPDGWRLVRRDFEWFLIEESTNEYWPFFDGFMVATMNVPSHACSVLTSVLERKNRAKLAANEPETS